MSVLVYSLLDIEWHDVHSGQVGVPSHHLVI